MSADSIHEWAGAYVLGALSADDRVVFEAHLSGCDACARDVVDFSVLPGLLSGIDESDLADPPESVRSRVLAATSPAHSGSIDRSRRRWRVGAALAAVAAAVLAAVLISDFITDDDPQPPQFAADAIELVVGSDYEALTGTISISERSWGSLILVDLFDVPQRDDYTMWTVGSDGSWTSVASWIWSEDGTCRVPGATVLSVDDIARVVVTGAHDRGDGIAWAAPSNRSG